LPLKVVGGKQPSTEERLERLERQVVELRGEIKSGLRRVESRLTGDLEGAVSQARDLAELRDTDLRRFLAAQLDAGIGRRWFGALLFATGLLAQTAANVVGIA